MDGLVVVVMVVVVCELGTDDTAVVITVGKPGTLIPLPVETGAKEVMVVGVIFKADASVFPNKGATTGLDASGVEDVVDRLKPKQTGVVDVCVPGTLATWVMEPVEVTEEGRIAAAVEVTVLNKEGVDVDGWENIPNGA